MNERQLTRRQELDNFNDLLVVLNNPNSTQEEQSKAFADIIAPHLDYLANLVAKFVYQKHVDIRLDVLQEVLISIWENIHSYDQSRGTFEAWIGTITKFRSYDALSKQTRYGARVAQLHDETIEFREVGPPTDPAEIVEYKLELAAILRAMAGLSDERQNVIVAAMSGITRRQFAQMNDIPIGTVKTRKYLAEKAIAEELGLYTQTT